jgi:hypothetical protein
MELPFSLLRWVSIPCADRVWNCTRQLLAVVAPLGFTVAALVDFAGVDAALEPLPSLQGLPYVPAAVSRLPLGGVALGAAAVASFAFLVSRCCCDGRQSSYESLATADGNVVTSAAAAPPGPPGGLGVDHNAKKGRLPGCYPWLVVLAFVSSVVWMDLLASELVALMEAAGTSLGVSTAILGLTVLALVSHSTRQPRGRGHVHGG